MTPEIAVLLIQVLVKYGPGVYAAARSILMKTTVTEADFASLDAILAKDGASYFK
jgi:hypothetical protein